MIITGTPSLAPTVSWQEFMRRKENKTLTVNEARRKYMLELQEDYKDKLLTNFFYGTLNWAVAEANTFTPGYAEPGIGYLRVGVDFIVG